MFDEIDRAFTALRREELAGTVIRQQYRQPIEPTYGVSAEVVTAYGAAGAEWFERQATMKGSDQ